MRYIVNFHRPHPLKFDTNGKPAGLLVDYNITLILVPSIVIGSAIGVIINYIMATPIQLAIQIAFLVSILATTSSKLLAICRTERAAKRKSK
jgi:hypothetical protein